MSNLVIYLGPPESTPWVREFLGATFDVCFCSDAKSAVLQLPEATAILDASMKIAFSRERLSAASNLKVFVTATTGANHIDEKALAERGIPLLTLKGQRDLLKNITPAAELSWLLLMACARGLRGASEDVLSGIWDRDRHPGVMLRGRTLGIIGCGRIGQWMARYAEAFGMRSLGVDPNLDEWPASIERVELPTLLQDSDFISIHVTLTEQTRELLGETQFAKIKVGASIINTSRGEVINERCLIDALETGRVRAAGLDVISGEPDTEASALIKYARKNRRVIITPHIGGYSPDALRTVLEFSCRRLAEYVNQYARPTPTTR